MLEVRFSCFCSAVTLSIENHIKVPVALERNGTRVHFGNFQGK